VVLPAASARVELFSLLGREDRVDFLIRPLVNRRDLRLLIFRQIKSAERVATATHSTRASWATRATTGTTDAALPAAARPPALHSALWRTLTVSTALHARALIIHSPRGTTAKLGLAAALIARALRVLLALRLRYRDGADHGDDTCTNCHKCAFHT
jgi:hypothetical protein